MVKRLFDFILALFIILICLPVMFFAVVGILVSGKGPVIYKARRVGLKGEVFTMYKFRTMSTGQSAKSVITGVSDVRVFPFGRLLRNFKIDELPQLFNILKGQMSFVGPRPEDPWIVEKYYSKEQLDTLDVRPGLTSPGSLFNYTHGENYLSGKDAEKAYVDRLLPVKLALDIYYVRNRSFIYDIEIILRTVAILLKVLLNRNKFGYPKEFNIVFSRTFLTK